MPVVTSEIAGSVWKIEVQAGQSVSQGDVLIILESMKMEIPIEAPCAGEVAEILVAEGSPVAEDQALVRLDAL